MDSLKCSLSPNYKFFSSLSLFYLTLPSRDFLRTPTLLRKSCPLWLHPFSPPLILAPQSHIFRSYLEKSFFCLLSHVKFLPICLLNLFCFSSAFTYNHSSEKKVRTNSSPSFWALTICNLNITLWHFPQIRYVLQTQRRPPKCKA